MTIGALAAVVGAQKDIYLAVARAADLLPVAVRREDQVRAGRDPVRRRRACRTSGCRSTSPTDDPRSTASCARQQPVAARRGRRARSSTGSPSRVDLPSHIAIVGPAGSGKEELTLVLAGLLEPMRGRVLISDLDLHRLPEAVPGRRIGYVGNPTMIFAGTIEDNLLFGLKHRPQRPRPRAARTRCRATSARCSRPSARATARTIRRPTGSTTRAAGHRASPRSVCQPRCAALEHGPARSATSIGWACAAPSIPRRQPELPERLLEARRAMQERLREPRASPAWSSCSTPSATTPTPRWPRTCCSASPVGPTFDHRAARRPALRARRPSRRPG